MSKTGAGLVAGTSIFGLSAMLLARRRFADRLNALDEKLAEVQTGCDARGDLPEGVSALANRLGSGRGNQAAYVDLRQAGTMWFKRGGAPIKFTARQRVGTSNSGFVWRAAIGPLGLMTVVDSFVAGTGMLEARVFGLVRVAHQDGTIALNQGEALRYLAEIPWNPDIILFDRALEWSGLGPRSIKVATGIGESRAEITFGLDDAGFIGTVSAESRSFSADKRYPWHGRFWDYQDRGGRRIPTHGEVAWVIDGADFIYWRGEIEDWLTRSVRPRGA